MRSETKEIKRKIVTNTKKVTGWLAAHEKKKKRVHCVSFSLCTNQFIFSTYQYFLLYSDYGCYTYNLKKTIFLPRTTYQIPVSIDVANVIHTYFVYLCFVWLSGRKRHRKVVKTNNFYFALSVRELSGTLGTCETGLKS